MSWEDIEEAMQAAVVDASQLAADKVYWSYQDYNEEDGDYVVITFGGAQTVGQDFIRRTFDASRPNGQELREDVMGTREVPFQIEVFTSEIYGETAARQRAERIRTAMRLSGIRQRLRRVNVSPFDPGPVSWVPDILAAEFRGRAVTTIRCYVPVLDCFSYVGYISRLKVRVTPSGWQGIPSGATSFIVDSSGSSGYFFSPP